MEVDQGRGVGQGVTIKIVVPYMYLWMGDT